MPSLRLFAPSAPCETFLSRADLQADWRPEVLLGVVFDTQRHRISNARLPAGAWNPDNSRRFKINVAGLSPLYPKALRAGRTRNRRIMKCLLRSSIFPVQYSAVQKKFMSNPKIVSCCAKCGHSLPQHTSPYPPALLCRTISEKTTPPATETLRDATAPLPSILTI